MAERSRWTDERMDDFVAHITARFDQIDARFATMDSRFDRLEARIGRLEVRMDRLEIRVERLSWLMAGVLMTQLVVLALLGYVATRL